MTMRQISLSQGKFALVDDEDFDRVSQYKWYFNDGYAMRYEKGKRIRMHRFILDAPDGVEVDHRNRNKLDQRRENLRLCTGIENKRNLGIRKDNTSGYKNVYLDRSTGHWRSAIYVNGKPIHFGSFKEKRHAAMAHAMFVKDFHGEFATSNFTAGEIVAKS